MKGEVAVDDSTEIREKFISRSSQVPLWHRQNLSVEEAGVYTGLGSNNVYKLIKQDDCDFTFKIGSRTMIKRKRFEEYLEKLYSI